MVQTRGSKRKSNKTDENAVKDPNKRSKNRKANFFIDKEPTTYKFSQVSLNCPICIETLVLPVSIGCGHTFCELCIEKLLSSGASNKCPTCRTMIHGTGWKPNILLSEILEESGDEEYKRKLENRRYEKTYLRKLDELKKSQKFKGLKQLTINHLFEVERTTYEKLCEFLNGYGKNEINLMLLQLHKSHRFFFVHEQIIFDEMIEDFIIENMSKFTQQEKHYIYSHLTEEFSCINDQDLGDKLIEKTRKLRGSLEFINNIESDETFKEFILNLDLTSYN